MEDEKETKVLLSLWKVAPKADQDEKQEWTLDEQEWTLDEAMENIGFGWFHKRLLLICGLCFMGDSIEVFLLSFLQKVLKEEWNLSSMQSALITSVVFVGELIGALFWGRFADSYGRRISYALVAATVGVFGLLSVTSHKILHMLIFRGLVGFGVGGFTIPFDLLAEFLPSKQRGRYLVYTNVFWTLGSLLSAGVAWLVLPTLGWRWMTAIASIPALLSVLCVPITPESPRFLHVQGRDKEAVKIILEVARINKVVVPKFRTTSVLHEEGSIKDLFQPKFRRTTFAVWTLWISFGFVYYGIVLLAPDIFSSKESDQISVVDSINYFDIFINSSSEIFGLLLSLYCCENITRISTLKISYFFTGICVVLLGVTSLEVVLLVFSIGARLFIMSASVVTWVYTAEVYPTFIRGTGHSTANSVARISAALTPFCANSLQPISITFTSIVYCIVSMMGAWACTKLEYETFGKHLSDTADEMTNVSADKSNDSSFGGCNQLELAST